MVRNIANAKAFDKAIMESKEPVFVKFWVPWCSHCRAMKPRVERLEERYGDRVRFVALNIDKAARTRNKYHIHGVPEFIIFLEGSPIGRTGGEQSQRELGSFIKKALDRAGA